MSEIAASLDKTIASIPSNVVLVAVSKTKPNSSIMEAYSAGQRVFGENKVQDLATKAAQLPQDIEWHMIGHLQSNKVKHIASFVSLIHGVDSLKLLKEINKRGAQHNRVINCLLQVHIAQEQTKFGLNSGELQEILEQSIELKNVSIIGLMGMATNTPDDIQVRREFSSLKDLILCLQKVYPKLQVISMGMSGDYQIAIEEGSTMVRVGSAIFGARS